MRRAVPILGVALALGGLALSIGSLQTNDQAAPGDLILACLTLVLGGGGVLWWWRSRLRAEESAAIEISAVPGVERPTGVARRQRPTRPRFSGIPAFGILASSTFMLVVVSLWVMQSGRLPPQGLWVLTPRWSLPPASADPSRTPLVLRIDGENRWYLQEKPTSREALGPALQAEFSRRAEWVVCLEADTDLDYQVAVSAMDVVQRQHGRVVIAAPAGPPGPCARYPQDCRGPVNRYADRKKNRSRR